MTIPTTSVPSVRVALKTAITSQINDNEVEVSNGDPAPGLPDDVIKIGEIQRQVTPLAMVGDGTRNAFQENYMVEIVVSSQGTDPDTVDLRAWTLAADVETAVRNDMTLGGLVKKADPGNTQSAGPYWSDDHTNVICDVFVFVNVFNSI